MSAEPISFEDWMGGTAGVIEALASLPYVLAIYRRKTTPNRVTWFVWSIIGWLTLSSYHEAGAGSTLWLAFSYAVFHTVIFFMSITRGEGGWSSFDLSCLAIAVLGLTLWWFTDSALAGLGCFLAADFVAALPTIRKSWSRPQSEDRLAWTLAAVATGVNLFAIDQLEFGIILYPVYMAVIQSLIAFFVWRPAFKRIHCNCA